MAIAIPPFSQFCYPSVFLSVWEPLINHYRGSLHRPEVLKALKTYGSSKKLVLKDVSYFSSFFDAYEMFKITYVLRRNNKWINLKARRQVYINL